jgi:hypothetical protein
MSALRVEKNEGNSCRGRQAAAIHVLKGRGWDDLGAEGIQQ